MSTSTPDVTSPATSQAVHPDLDPWHGILYTVIEHLAPLFKSAERGATYARYAAGEAIAAFNPESRADYASIGRILALSLSAIAVAAQSTDPDLPAAERLRFLNKVQSLSRTADQAERTMMARRGITPAPAPGPGPRIGPEARTRSPQSRHRPPSAA